MAPTKRCTCPSPELAAFGPRALGGRFAPRLSASTSAAAGVELAAPVIFEKRL
jgi:hypothetical protein